VLLIASATRPAFAVRPMIIMFYGPGLEHPVFLTDTMVFHDLENPTTITPRDVGNRKYLNVAMFWGTQWNPYVSGERPLSELTSMMANQHGRFYPATASAPAVLLQTKPQLERAIVPTDTDVLTWGGELTPNDVAFLVRSGVPTGPRGPKT
jgi:hypothetical protein